jgi:hypothetical protein
MPTPFTHLHITTQLAADPCLDDGIRNLIQANLPAFLLGGVVADAKPSPLSDRTVTHFYHYSRPMPDNPWREMLREHPSLTGQRSQAHQVFLMGYVSHLATDEYWSRRMLHPHFARGEWGGSLADRFFVLHLLLIHMDERDLGRLEQGIAGTLRACLPDRWLPFMEDRVICEWRDFIADQITGESKTLEIFGERILTQPDKLRALLDDIGYMQSHLWDHITPALLAGLESQMYAFAREQLEIFVREFILAQS